MSRIDLKIILIIFLFSTAAGLLYNRLNSRGIELIAVEKSLKWKSSLPVSSSTEEPYAVNLQQAKELYDQNGLFIDAREKEDFLQGHIKGSVNIPFDDLENYESEIKKINKESIIVTYCGGTDCDLSILLGNKFSEMGYKNVFIFFGGWIKWLDAGYPAEENPEKK